MMEHHHVTDRDHREECQERDISRDRNGNIEEEHIEISPVDRRRDRKQIKERSREGSKGGGVNE
jgi:hypothetical protein